MAKPKAEHFIWVDLIATNSNLIAIGLSGTAAIPYQATTTAYTLLRNTFLHGVYV